LGYIVVGKFRVIASFYQPPRQTPPIEENGMRLPLNSSNS